MRTLLSLIINKGATCNERLTCFLLTVLCLSALRVASSAPPNVTITRNILSVEVTATSPIAFNTVIASSTTVSASASTVTNTGDQIQTYSLRLTDPSGWTAVQAAPGAGVYCLSAMFSTAQPAADSFSYANHALATADPGPACSATQFGNGTPLESGLSVPPTALNVRSLWFKFEAPSSTTVTTQQSITVTVTAAAA